MALSKERIGELAMFALQENLEKEGKLKLMPTEIKRSIKNSAKETKIPEKEIAEFMKVLLTNGFNKTVAELDKFIDSKVE